MDIWLYMGHFKKEFFFKFWIFFLFKFFWLTPRGWYFVKLGFSCLLNVFFFSILKVPCKHTFIVASSPDIRSQNLLNHFHQSLKFGTFFYFSRSCRTCWSFLFLVSLEDTPVCYLDGEGLTIEASVFPWSDHHLMDLVLDADPYTIVPCLVDESLSCLMGFKDPHFLGPQSSTGALKLNDVVDSYLNTS